MDVREREAGDAARLRALARRERDALQRDRYRAVLLALEGADEPTITEKLGRARRSVQAWVYAYRDGGIGALTPPRRPGRAPKLARDREPALRARLDAGPRPEDGVCTLRGADVRRILEREFGVKYSLQGAYDLLHRLGYSCPGAAAASREAGPRGPAGVPRAERPPFVRTIRDALAPHGGRVRVFFMDEARFGQQGTMTRTWARTGSRPTVVKQTKYEWVYLYAAVEPATGADVALQAPEVNTETFNVFLRMLAEELGPKDHAILLLDRAGWHTSRRVTPPDSITMLLLPAYSPELNPVENLWQYLRSHHLSNRAYRDYTDILDAGATAYRALTPERIRSVCRCPYLERETQA